MNWMERAKGWHRFGDWLEDLEGRGVSVNVGSFICGATVPEFARGEEMGPSSPEEIETMRRVMAEVMEDGAFCRRHRLDLPAGSYADTDELVAVCEVVARYHGVHITHMRSEEGPDSDRS